MPLLPTLTGAAVATDTPLAITASALVLGVSGSLHCFLMCGPLACAATPVTTLRTPSTPKRANSALPTYHAARIAAYGGIGGCLGLFGDAFSRGFALPLRAVLPWVLVAALLASALDLGERIAPIPAFANIVQRATRRGVLLSPRLRAAILGGITPLLPCGLLYGVFAAAFTTASFTGGALLLAMFSLGGAPALLGAQLVARLPAARGVRGRLRGVSELALRRAVPLLAAAVIAVRAIQAARGEACH